MEESRGGAGGFLEVVAVVRRIGEAHAGEGPNLKVVAPGGGGQNSLCVLCGLCGKYVTAIPARSTKSLDRKDQQCVGSGDRTANAQSGVKGT